jgi:hypothetical protein
LIGAATRIHHFIIEFNNGREMTAMAALREQWQAQKQQRQADAAQRRQTVQAHLNTLQQTRLDWSADLRQHLSQVEQHRHAHAEQTRAALMQYTADLQASVQQMQEQLQAQLATLHLEGEALRASQRQSRIAVGRDHQQDRIADVQTLKAEVATFLEDLSRHRQQVATANRDTLQQSIDALFDDFACFRQQLVADRANLRQVVWGVGPYPQSPTVAKPTGQVRPPAVRRSASSAPVAAPKATAASAKASDVSIEERVYNHLQAQDSGARLTEIESGLQINRFQAVDALRSLIQKDLVVQKDRTYYIQEDPMP